METKRQRQVAELVRRNFGPILQQQGSYIYGDAFVTVTHAKLTPDMGMAKIYLSVYNTENKQAVILNLQEHLPLLKSELSRRIRKHVRRIPSIEIYLDDTLDEIDRVDRLFDNLYDKNQMGDQEK